MNRTWLARGGPLSLLLVLMAATASLADRDSDRGRHGGGSWSGHGGASRPGHGGFNRPSFGSPSFGHGRPDSCDRPGFGISFHTPVIRRPDPFYWGRVDPWWDPFCDTLFTPWFDPWPRTVIYLPAPTRVRVVTPPPVRVVTPAPARVAAPAGVRQRKLIHIHWETIGNTVLVPLRSTFAGLGAQVIWDPDHLEGVVELNGHTVNMSAGASALSVLGSGGTASVRCEVGSVMMGTELFVPLQPICSALGLPVLVRDGLIEIGDEYCLIRQ